MMCQSCFKNRSLHCTPGVGGGGTPYNGLYGEAPPEQGTFFRVEVYKRVGTLHEKLALTIFDSHQKYSQSWTTIFDT